ncbi:MAG: glutamate synthase large subunit [Muribaculaceae bacterium]|nr:glutamate synthase large subunit [Muribaculaceae bacterium]
MKEYRHTLYDPSLEHDACGVGMIVNIHGVKYHDVVENALQVLEHMAHRGAEGADHKSGDGAGIMVQIPHEFILLNGIPIPEKGRYGVGMIFMPDDDDDYDAFLSIIRDTIKEENLYLMKIREVPVNNSVLGRLAKETEPRIRQIFIKGEDDLQRDVKLYEEELRRKFYVIEKKIEKKVAESSRIKDKDSCYIVSLSTRILIYKGMLTSHQLRYFFPDLINPYFTSAFAMVHSRFSTNTFPQWRLAQPFRIIAHNGEINTIKGNRMWMHTRESVLKPDFIEDIQEISPLIQPGLSDSASLDNAVEFFVKAGFSLPHALAMLIPESYGDKNLLSSRIKGFYEYHSIFMEPWDGPAAVMFSDGKFAGGLLDRNGLRPGRYLITDNGMLILASETGVANMIPPSSIIEKGKIKPGKMIMVDLEKGLLLRNDEIKTALAESHPYKEWLHSNVVNLGSITSGRKVGVDVENHHQLMQVFGFSAEDVETILKPMVKNRQEPTLSMGDDRPIAVLSNRPQRFFDYFKQMFAQVTNPPIDSLREKSVMSLTDYIGGVCDNVLKASPDLCKVVELSSPIISNVDLDNLKNLSYKGFKTITIDMTYPVEEGAEGLENAIHQLCLKVEKSVDDGFNYIILSDKKVDSERAPIPSLIAVSAVHQHLISTHKRAQTAIIVEAGDVMGVMEVALLSGYGASGVNPYLTFSELNRLVKNGELQLDYETAKKYYIKAINKGLLKIISKMGISTLRSYKGSMLFETVGVSSSLLNKYFGGGISKIEGIDIPQIAQDIETRHKEAFKENENSKEQDRPAAYKNEGIYKYMPGGEVHSWHPSAVKTLAKSLKEKDFTLFKEFTSQADNSEHPVFLRNMLEIVGDRDPIPIEEVESEESIIKRFIGGAMSFGAISKKAHEDIALALNKMGCRSNTGEGGEDPERFSAKIDGVSLRSATKQVASGRFGVTTEYLVEADEIQIKIAQGAKPGEGGQLPGFKINEMIAKTRHSIPGITLISPPPHHDIYSIEDLSQLIFDLKNVNPEAIISVKLVAESGVGTVAAGVAKAKADLIVVSGGEGGTGASPASSIRYAGLPMELGLSEIQQTLVLNNLRGKVRLQCDGQMKTGRDVVISALLGAEEFGFSTSLLIALGCVMDRKCHTNTCPVGIATQCEELINKYKGDPERIVTYFHFLAKEVREILAQMGYKSIEEIIGRVDLLRQKHYEGKLATINLSKLLASAKTDKEAIKWEGKKEHLSEDLKDHSLIIATQNAIEQKIPIEFSVPIFNTDRSVGAMLSGFITKKFPKEELDKDTVKINFEGSAGQSFGAFLIKGVSFNLEGDANDYLGKGLSGGKITVKPPKNSPFLAEKNIIAGNTLLYGATSGEVYINGQVGERFCVRNSGAIAVVEGVGDHCCEYMTGGRVVVLGPTGNNFAAGMSGGIAYVWNPLGNFDSFCNLELVELTLVDNEHDNHELRKLIETHYEETGSQLASVLLSDWQKSVGEFIKVTPIEYKKIIESEKE